jgi:hypothetical protein
MVTKATAGSTSPKKADVSAAPIKVTDDGRLAVNDTAAVDRSKLNDGGPGPDSSLKTGEGSANGALAAPSSPGAVASKGMAYDVQVHTDEKGLEVVRVTAESGDEAAQKALAQKAYRGTSIRGVTPASDPDANSLGGERDAGIMYANSENGGLINPLGTPANAVATEKLGHADVSELGE